MTLRPGDAVLLSVDDGRHEQGLFVVKVGSAAIVAVSGQSPLLQDSSARYPIPGSSAVGFLEVGQGDLIQFAEGRAPAWEAPDIHVVRQTYYTRALGSSSGERDTASNRRARFAGLDLHDSDSELEEEPVLARMAAAWGRGAPLSDPSGRFGATSRASSSAAPPPSLASLGQQTPRVDEADTMDGYSRLRSRMGRSAAMGGGSGFADDDDDDNIEVMMKKMWSCLAQVLQCDQHADAYDHADDDADVWKGEGRGLGGHYQLQGPPEGAQAEAGGASRASQGRHGVQSGGEEGAGCLRRGQLAVLAQQQGHPLGEDARTSSSSFSSVTHPGLVGGRTSRGGVGVRCSAVAGDSPGLPRRRWVAGRISAASRRRPDRPEGVWRDPKGARGDCFVPASADFSATPADELAAAGRRQEGWREQGREAESEVPGSDYSGAHAIGADESPEPGHRGVLRELLEAGISLDNLRHMLSILQITLSMSRLSRRSRFLKRLRRVGLASDSTSGFVSAQLPFLPMHVPSRPHWFACPNDGSKLLQGRRCAWLMAEVLVAGFNAWDVFGPEF
eukprot:TRINITY_DN74752_c0_g1_i1.p1 TRINITY_DN74752_c0_g1~~TRINITY_DN74752_c0_g1_i1.p1  ORF type:complete len:560 (+),score=54.92 TRINITY_DN74752_c0_g1_i1:50-1729(+)